MSNVGTIRDGVTGVVATVKANPNSGNNEILVNLEGHICSDNTTTTALGVTGVFTGEWQDTLDYGVVSVNVNTDEDSATDGLDVQWSVDGVTVHDHDYFTILADIPKTFTFGPANRYVRIVYTNGEIAQTSFNLQTLLRRVYVKPSSHRIHDPIVGQDDAELVKAVLTGINTGDDSFVNIESTYANSLKTSIHDGETGRRTEVDPLGALKVETPVRLVGTTFSNGTKDTNFWVETVTGSGSVTQAGEITLSTGTTADSTAKYATVRKARKITGTTNQFRAVARNIEEPSADCIRRIGPYDADEGFFFQFDGTVFGVASRKSGVDTVVTNGNFNGNGGETITLADTDFVRIVIEYTALSARFFANGTLIHTISAVTASLTNSLNLPVTMEIINENGEDTDHSYEILFATILRLGELQTEATYKFISTNTTTICKYNAGRLKRITNVDNSGNVTIYDNTAASGTVIATIDTAKALGTLEFDVPFSDGLTVVTALGATILVIYE